MTQAELLAAHLAVQHTCCYIVGRPDGSGFDRCGQWCGHAGPCGLDVPGEYLAMPAVLNPLGMLRSGRAHWQWTPCPVCGRWFRTWNREVGVFSWRLGPGWTRQREGALWSFEPCGCEAFEPPGWWEWR